MIRRSTLLFVSFLVGVCSIGKTAEIAILNAGFEEPELDVGTWITGGEDWEFGIYYIDDPTEWIEGNDGNEVDGGVWNPDAEVGFTDGAFAGNNTGWATSRTEIDAGLSQVLTEQLQANTEYVLGVNVGNALYNESDFTAEYRLELLAGGVLLQAEVGEPPAADDWEHQSLTFNSGPNPAQAGERLEIRLIAVAYVDGGGVDGYEVDFDEVTLTAQGPDLGGDYNSDGLVNVLDVDLQAVAMKDPSPNLAVFDENLDGVVDSADRSIWIKDHAGTWTGDSNLDGEFSSADIVSVFTAGKFDTGQMAGWAEGDWNGDMEFQSGDLVAAFTEGGYELGPRVVAAVPEPSGLSLVLTAVMGCLLRGRRRRLTGRR